METGWRSVYVCPVCAPRRRSRSYVLVFFFFQAEDGIRDLTVTGVQTCALPICSELLAAERLLLGEAVAATPRPAFRIDTALQGEEGVARVQQALEEDQPYAMAFIDMRMPPGWDGLETIQRLWQIDPHVQVVICSAHADYDWTEVVARLDHSDKLLVIKKPFEPIEVLQCANALTRKWDNERILRRQVDHLEHVVEARTQGLEAANKQLRHLASHDALTGLPNRVLLDDRLAQAVAHPERDGPHFRLPIFD